MRQSKFLIASIVLIILAITVVGCDSIPPIISETAALDITSATATITWTTDEPATSQVEYGETDQYGASTSLDETLTASHQVALTELEPNTTYHYRVKSKYNAANEAVSADFSFTTGPMVWTDGRLGLILDRVVRTDVLPDDLRFSICFNTKGLRSIPDVGCDFFCVYLTIFSIEGIYVKYMDLPTYQLFDAEGNQISLTGYDAVMGIAYNTDADEVVPEGSTCFGVFELPTQIEPTTLKFIYNYKNTEEEEDYQEGQIDIILP